METPNLKNPALLRAVYENFTTDHYYKFIYYIIYFDNAHTLKKTSYYKYINLWAGGLSYF